MKIALNAMGTDRWIAGVYYISNLVRALNSLPDGERPEITLVRSAETNADLFGDIDNMVEWFQGGKSSAKGNMSAALRRSALGLARYSSVLFKIARVVGRGFQQRSSIRLLSELKKNGVSLLFPCLTSMGKDAPTSWIPWIWDLQHKYYPELFPRYERRRRDKLFKCMVSDARVVVTSSMDTADSYDKFYPGNRHKLRVLRFRTYPIEKWYEGDVALTCRKYNLPEKYLMVPNQFFAHKNHRVAFEAANILSDRGCNVHMVCTGNTNDWRNKEYYQGLCRYIQMNGLGDRIRILGLIPRMDQIQVMRGAMAVVQPSLFEGWSTVVEDARAMGKRIYLSDIPVHREQDPPHVVYFNPENPADLADKIEATWNSLSPGPCLSDERAAHNTQRLLVRDYARTFIGISRELVELSA